MPSVGCGGGPSALDNVDNVDDDGEANDVCYERWLGQQGPMDQHSGDRLRRPTAMKSTLPCDLNKNKQIYYDFHGAFM